MTKKTTIAEGKGSLEQFHVLRLPFIAAKLVQALHKCYTTAATGDKDDGSRMRTKLSTDEWRIMMYELLNLLSSEEVTRIAGNSAEDIAIKLRGRGTEPFFISTRLECFA